MAEDRDASSDENAPGEEESSKSKVNITQDNVKEVISNLLLSTVEYLTKICVICEGDNVADHSSIKTLAKLIYEFEKSLKKLQKVIEYSYNQSLDLGTVVKGLIKAVDDYSNPYDWLYDNVVDKYVKSGQKLDASLTVIDRFQNQLMDRLQFSKIEETNEVENK